MPQHTVGARDARGYASLRVWVPNVLCYQWMMTLNLGHNVSKSALGVISQKVKE